MIRERLNEAEIRWLRDQGILCTEQGANNSIDPEEVTELLRWMPRALWPQSEAEERSERNNTQRRHRGMGQYD